MHDDGGIGTQPISHSMRDQMDRAALTAKVISQGIVGPVHPAGLCEIPADDGDRYHVATRRRCTTDRLTERVAAVKSAPLRSQNSSPDWLTKRG